MPKIINFETGIILPESEIELDANTPIKLYLDDLVAIFELRIGMKELLFELTQTINLEGIIVLTPTRKNQRIIAFKTKLIYYLSGERKISVIFPE